MFAVCYPKKIYCEIQREKVEMQTKKLDSVKDISDNGVDWAISLIIKFSAQEIKRKISKKGKFPYWTGDGF